MSIKRFSNPKTLRGLGRPLLKRFFAKFHTGLTAKNITLPDETLEDGPYFDALAKVFLSPNALPDDLIEVLYAVVEMGNEKGEERLLKAAQDKGLRLVFPENASHLDIAMEIWLADPELLTEVHSEHHLVCLTSFQYFGTKVALASRLPFTPPSATILDAMREAIDKWCEENHRGAGSAEISMHELDGEWWFLIRHGGSFTRTSRVDGRKRDILHFRPDKDDVVVYCPARDEIRIHADTKRERELYRTEFGKGLRGDHWYFSQPKAYTLDPLREDVEQALSTEGIAGIKRIVLQEIEVQYGGLYSDSVIKRSSDMVASAASRSIEGQPRRLAVPAGGMLIRAVFEFEFTDSKKPRRVYLRPANSLRLARHCDAWLVHDWLSKRGFRAPARAESIVPAIPRVEMVETAEALNVEAVAIP